VFCSDCSKFERPIPKFGYTDAVRVCAKCNSVCQCCEDLDRFIRAGDVLNCKHLLERGRLELNFTTADAAPLAVAAEVGNAEVIRLLMEYGAGVDWTRETGGGGGGASVLRSR
jgi:hypothetical protein